MTTKVFIDGSNMWYRAYTATELYRPGGPVSVMTYMLRRVCREYGINNVCICWDAGDGGRKTLDDQYKSQRKAVEGVWEDIVYMKTMVDCLGVPNAHKKGFEADDVAGSLACQSSEKALILSYDKDFYQLVSNRINVLRPERTVRGVKVPRKIIDRDEVIEEFGTTPEKLILYKTFRGDTSDNIPKLNIRFTKKFKEPFFKVLTISNTLDEFYSHIEMFDKKYHLDLLAFKQRAAVNQQLVTIHTNLDIKVEKPKLDSNKFEVLCEELEISRLKIDDWSKIPKEPPPPPPIQHALF
jgi:DNA polymerase-1